MIKYILGRFAVSILAVWLLVTITFFLVQFIPGDPISSDKLRPEIRVNLEKYYGLDKPLFQQYTTYMSNLIKGDMGFSFKQKGRTVNQIIGTAFPASMQLGMMALVLAVVVGLILGTAAALNHNKGMDYVAIFIAILGVSVPSFVMASLLQYFIALGLGWFPVAMWKTPAHYVLPVISLSFGTIAIVARLMRNNMLEVVNQDYIKTAKAKGLSQFRITINHQIRNAILPVVTILGPTAAALLTGAFVVEQIFAIPGLGKYYVSSIQSLDYTMILGLTVFYGSFLIILNFIVDIIYGLVDPRIRLGK